MFSLLYFTLFIGSMNKYLFQRLHEKKNFPRVTLIKQWKLEVQGILLENPWKVSIRRFT